MKKFFIDLSFTALGFILCFAILLSSGSVFAASSFIVGDVNDDGIVNSLDVIILARHIANWKGYETLPYIKDTEPLKKETFVITETPNRRFFASNGGVPTASAASGQIGIQKLENGVPVGTVFYISAENLGFDAETADEYLNYTVTLENFDTETLSFEGAIVGDSPRSLAYTDVDYSDDGTNLIVDGVTYTAVDLLSASSETNEIIVYECTPYTEIERKLITNEAGDITDSSGNVLAPLAYESTSGNKYYADTSSGTNTLINETQALALYGICVGEPIEYTHTLITSTTLNGNSVAEKMCENLYSILLFDDDRDGDYDRAFYDILTYDRFIVVQDISGFDLYEIYLNMYVDGELTEGALVTDILGNHLSTLSAYRFSMILSKKEYYYPGTIYAATVTGDAYSLKAIVADSNFEDYGLINAKVASTDAVDGAGSIKFNDNCSENPDTSLMIRIDSDTVFYFIQPGECDCDLFTATGVHDDECASIDPYEVTITVLKGQPDNATIFFDENTDIWTDKLGYGNTDQNGIASVVFIVGNMECIAESLDPCYVYISNTSDFLINSAEAFGLPQAYTDNYYRYESAALNLDDASVITIYSKVKLTAAGYYKIDENGVVVDKADDVITEATGTRHFIKYGIGNFNGSGATSTSNRWGSYYDKDWKTMTVDIYDYIWATDLGNIRKGPLESKQKELADALMDVIAGNTAIADHPVLGGAKLSAQAYIDWVVNNNDGVIEFIDIPQNYADIRLVDPILYAEYNDDGYLTIEVLRTEEEGGFAGLTQDDYLLDQEDHVKNIIVVDNDNINAKWTGMDAIEILNNAPYIALVGAVDAGDAENAYLVENLFKELLVDGTIVFLVDYNNL